MKILLRNDGYTLIETLVALTLVLLLLFFVSEILPVISMSSEQRLILSGINHARNQMAETLSFSKYLDIARDINRQLYLTQSVQNKGTFLHIIITIKTKSSHRTIFHLQAYENL